MKKIISLNTLIAIVWFINGLFCKILNLVPRHGEIVYEITNTPYSRELTIAIGILEVMMSIWILSKIYPKLNTIVQIVIIALMNIIEIIEVPHLLFWGKYNSLFAFLLIVLIYLNFFHFNKTSKTKHNAFQS